MYAILYDEYGVHKRIWSTEMGWMRDFTAGGCGGAPWAGVFGGFQLSNADQASRLVTAFAYARTHWPWLGAMFVFNLDYDRRPQDLCTDEQFIRRASLDITGTIPSPEEIRKFAADKDAAKRDKLIDRLLETPEYSYYFANKWADILRVKRRNVPDRANGTFAFHTWIREAVAALSGCGSNTSTAEGMPVAKTAGLGTAHPTSTPAVKTKHNSKTASTPPMVYCRALEGILSPLRITTRCSDQKGRVSHAGKSCKTAF